MNDPRLYDLTPRFVDYEDGTSSWVVGADLRGAFGTGSNHVARAWISQALEQRLPGLAKRLTFDVDDTCFLAYAINKDDADDLVSMIIGLIAQRG